jgi:metal-responsive CopG/Arc/MetJ family transcriptional regulator
MKRTQIYLEEELDRDLREAAKAEGRSAAALIREAVRRYLAGTKRTPEEDPFLSVAGSIRGGPRDSALSHDRYLYGGRPTR